MANSDILNENYLRLIVDRDIAEIEKQMRLLDNDIKEYRKEMRAITKSISNTYRIKTALEAELKKIIEGDKEQ